LHADNCKAHITSGTLVALTEDELITTGEKVLTANVVIGRKLKCVLGYVRCKQIPTERAQEWMDGALYFIDDSVKFSPDELLKCDGIFCLSYVGRIDSGIVDEY
jgi:hypothetical protein